MHQQPCISKMQVGPSGRHAERLIYYLVKYYRLAKDSSSSIKTYKKLIECNEKMNE